jgi:hypothetical protein
MKNSRPLKLTSILKEAYKDIATQYRRDSEDDDINNEKDLIAFSDNTISNINFDEMAGEFMEGSQGPYDFDFPSDMVQDKDALIQKLKKGAEVILASADSDMDIDNSFENLVKYNRYLGSEFVKLFPYTSNREAIDNIYDGLYNAIKIAM